MTDDKKIAVKPEAQGTDKNSTESKIVSNNASTKVEKSSKAAEHEDGAKDDKGVKKGKNDVDNGSGEKDTTDGSQDKKNNSLITKSPKSKLTPAAANKDGPVDKKCDKAKDDGNDDDDDANTDEKHEDGIPLGKIPEIEKYIASTRTEVLQTLHQICLDTVGKTNLLKKNLRQFAGFDFDKDSDEYEKKLKEIQKVDLPKLRGVCEGLQLDKKGSKEAISQRICEFLLAPACIEGADDEDVDEEEEIEEEEEDEEEEISEDDKTKRKRSAARGAATGRNAREDKVSKTGRPRRSTAGRGKADLSSYVEYSSSEEDEKFTKKQPAKRKRADDSDSGSDYNPSDSDNGKKNTARLPRGRPARNQRSLRRQKSSESEEEETPASSDDDYSDEPRRKSTAKPTRAQPSRGRPARGRKPAESESEEESEPESDQSVEYPKKKAPTARYNANNKAVPKPRAKRTAAASSKPIKETSSGDEDGEKDDNESEDDEPLSKKSKPSPPSDDEIKKYVKEILDKANLEEITMKTVCKQVYEKYPDFDLSHKKEFIKTTVKSLISN